MAFNLVEAKKFSSARKKDLELWNDVDRAIEAIEANKQYLTIAEQKKIEYKGNVEALAEVNKQVADKRDELKALDGEVDKVKAVIVDGMASLKKRLKNELDASLADRRIAFESELEGLKSEVRRERADLDTIKAELTETKADLNTIRSSIAGVLA